MDPPPVHNPMQQSKAADHGGYLPAVRGWDGEPETGHCSLLKCCGDGSCDCKQGWGVCCLGYWCPCILFGLNMRDGHKKSVAIQAAVFFFLLVCPGVFWNVWVPTTVNPQVSSRTDCLAIPVFTVATIIVLCVYYATLIAGLIYVTVYRARLRRKLNIDTCCCECGLVWCCLHCALCQERRTLHRLGMCKGAAGADQGPGAVVMAGMAPKCGSCYTVPPTPQPAMGMPVGKGGDAYV